jgi:hypothetical protein
LCRLVEDIDSTRMLIHIRQGKGGKDRVPLSPKRWRPANLALIRPRPPVPGTVNGSRAVK